MNGPRSEPRRAVTRALSPENLARDFAAKANVARQGVRVFYQAIVTGQPAALGQWASLQEKVSGRDPARQSPKIERLAAHYGTPPGGLRPEAMLFALHTYYAVVVRLLVARVMAHYRGRPSPAEMLAAEEICEQLPQEAEQLEAGDGVFSWYTAARSDPITQLIRQLAARLAEYELGTLPAGPAGGGDLLGGLYQGLFPRALRHELGEYYTPGWLAEHVLDAAGYCGDPGCRLLDPACGSGTFLLAAISRVRRWYDSNPAADRPSEGEVWRKVLANVVGMDLNPLAVIAARANYLIALADLLPRTGRVEIPVYLCDSILGGAPGIGRFDYVVGNPPWIAWDNLPADYREATKPLWQRYGLFSLSGSQGRHGGAKKDLSMLMVYAAADRFVEPGGRLAMVVTQTLLQTKGAGDGFRRFRLGPDGEHLKVLRVDDLAALRPFREAANLTSTIVLEKGRPTTYPVPYVKWSADDTADGGFARRGYRAEPIDPRRPGSPWLLHPEGFEADQARLVGPSDYVARLGANSGGANGVYWVRLLGRAPGGVLVRNLAEKNKRGLPTVQHVLEPDLLYPLLRWRDVGRYRAAPSAYVLLAQDVVTRTGIDPATMRRRYPRTYAYLERFEAALSGRAAYRRYQQGNAFYSMYNVGNYTLCPIKVVWRRMDRRINAAVVEPADCALLGRRPVVPQETCVLIAADSAAEAHYLCAVLNSSIVDFLVRSHSVCGGKGFGTPSMLDYLRLRRFDPLDRRHEELAACSRVAHLAASCGNAPAEAQRRIDQLAAELWDLDPSQLAAIGR